MAQSPRRSNRVRALSCFVSSEDNGTDLSIDAMSATEKIRLQRLPDLHKSLCFLHSFMICLWPSCEVFLMLAVDATSITQSVLTSKSL
jgi:hypothetical protein